MSRSRVLMVALFVALGAHGTACKRTRGHSQRTSASPSSTASAAAPAPRPASTESTTFGGFVAGESAPDGRSDDDASSRSRPEGEARKSRRPKNRSSNVVGLRTAPHVARTDDGLLVNDYYLTAITETANRVFRTAGFCLELDRKPYELPKDYLDVRTQRDFVRLRAKGRAAALDVVITETIFDTKLDRRISGKYREMERYSDAALIIVARGQGDAATMGHEIGHYLGLGHHDDQRNLMFGRDGPLRTRFDAKQKRQLRKELAALERRAEVRVTRNPQCATPVELARPARVKSGNALLYSAVERFTDGVVYRGEFLVDKPHGRGTVVFPDGKRYAGEFHDGRRTGVGVQHYPDGARYEGRMRAGKRHGKGTMVYPSGLRFEGKFAKDQPVEGIVIERGVRYRAKVEQGRVRPGKRLD